VRYRKDLDGIRAVAILAVMVGHTAYLWSASQRGSGGGRGVNLFFVLSGYLITTLLLSERAKTGGVDRAKFYGRRALRLGPALCLAIALGWLVLPYAGQHDDHVMSYGRSAIAALFFAGNWFMHRLGLLDHMWSLGVEEQYYLVWPAVLALGLAAHLRRRTLAGIALTGAFAVVVLRSSQIYKWPLHLAATRPVLAVEQMDGVLLGSALALLLAGNGRFVRVLDRRLLAYGALTVAAYLAFIFPAVPPEDLTLINICFVVVIGYVVRNPQSRMSSVLRTEPLAAIGRVSYGLYLYHWILFSWAHEVLHDPVVAIVTAWSLSLLAAGVSFVAIERPILRYKDRFRPKTSIEPDLATDISPRETTAALRL